MQGSLTKLQIDEAYKFDVCAKTLDWDLLEDLTIQSMISDSSLFHMQNFSLN